MGTLYIVATPIGNLEDLSFRALRILKEADFILCEDTRVTQKLLSHYSIQKPTLSYHQHSKLTKKEHIFELISQGKDLALVSDSGTPGISDPGNELIHFLLSKSQDIKIVPIPGPSALIVAASISGFPMDKFLFLGYPPRKKGRKKFFEEIVQSKYPVIFYEAPYRILKTLRELQTLYSKFEIVLCRELTKKFETFYRGTLSSLILKLEKERIRGEFTAVIWKG